MPWPLTPISRPSRVVSPTSKPSLTSQVGVSAPGMAKGEGTSLPTWWELPFCPQNVPKICSLAGTRPGVPPSTSPSHPSNTGQSTSQQQNPPTLQRNRVGRRFFYVFSPLSFYWELILIHGSSGGRTWKRDRSDAIRPAPTLRNGTRTSQPFVFPRGKTSRRCQGAAGSLCRDVPHRPQRGTHPLGGRNSRALGIFIQAWGDSVPGAPLREPSQLGAGSRGGQRGKYQPYLRKRGEECAARWCHPARDRLAYVPPGISGPGVDFSTRDKARIENTFVVFSYGIKSRWRPTQHWDHPSAATSPGGGGHHPPWPSPGAQK